MQAIAHTIRESGTDINFGTWGTAHVCLFVGARGMYMVKTTRMTKAAHFNTNFSGKNIDIDHEEPVNFHITKNTKRFLITGKVGEQ